MHHRHLQRLAGVHREALRNRCEDHNRLSSSIDLVITEGTGGDSTCAGFTPAGEIFNDTLAKLGSKKSFAAGVGSWTPGGTAPETRTYKIVYTLNAAAPNSTQDGTASLGFTWEAQNS